MIQNYKANNCFDEMLDGEGRLRAHYAKYQKLFQGLTPAEFEAKRQAMDMAFLRQGVTFNVYGDAQGAERIFPFDLIPRIIPAKEWEHIERGLAQRITALNLFLHDIYHEQKILKDGVIPEFYVLSAPPFPPRIRELRGAQGDLHPCLRHGFDPRPGRQLSGAGRQRALSVRRELCSGKSPRDEARVSADV